MKKKKVKTRSTQQISKQQHTPKQAQPVEQTQGFVFSRKNYMFMLIGMAVIALGFILMSGGESTDPNTFDESVYSFRRISLAPMLVMLGFAIEIYAILLNPKS